MKRSVSSQTGLTIPEIIVALAIVVILAMLALPDTGGSRAQGRGQMTQVLSNMKQLHLATQQMALDATTTGDTNIGWPGDTGGSFAVWATNLVGGNYLNTNDLCKLLSAAGKLTPAGQIPLTNNNAVLVYDIKEASATNAVIFTTANFTNTPTGGVVPLASAMPFREKGFVVFRKDGEGAILKGPQAGDTNVVGAYAPLCR